MTVMFLDFFGLREQPFGVTPDPKYLYFSPGHREALASLFYGIDSGRGFLALIAEPGMGKTTLLFQLLDRLKGSVRSAFLFQTQCDSRELLRYLLEALGLPNRENDLVALHRQLNEFLLGEARLGRRVVVFIDEAQNLSDSALETVRLLSNFEATDRKLFQIVLAGQPELANRLKRPGLAQLSQRIAVLTGLKRLPPEETVHYIYHRLQVAGYDGPELFNPEALTLIAERGKGIPRNINNICFNAMSVACAMGSKRIGPAIVKEALADLSLDSIVERPAGGRSITLTVPSMPRFSVKWLREKVIANRAVQTAMLSALLGSVATYLGIRSAVSTADPVAAMEKGTTTEIVRNEGATAARSGMRGGISFIDHRDGNSSGFFTYVVQPNDTVWNLCVWSVGRYDDAALSELRRLNPELTDPDRIEVGQQIRLPVRPSN